MPLRKSSSDLAPATIEFYESLQNREDLSPRVRMALRMYAHGACNLSQAADAMGLSVGYLSIVKNSAIGQKFMQTAHQIIDEKAANTSALIAGLSHRAVQVLGTMMEDSPSEQIRLKAAIDLADRGPETSKIQKHQVESFTLSGKDAQDIAAALVRGATVHERYAHLAEGNFDKVQEIPSVSTQRNSNTDDSIGSVGLDSTQRLLGEQSRKGGDGSSSDREYSRTGSPDERGDSAGTI
jgi:hypothetical protein